MNDGKKKLLSADGELMRALGITEDDLAANESGILLPHQHDVIRQGDGYRSVNQLAIGFIFGLIGVIALMVAVASITFEPQNLGASAGVALFGLIFGGVGYSSLASRNSLRKKVEHDIATNNLATMQGIAVVTIGDNDTRGYLEVNDQRFDVSEDVLKRIKHLEPYLVHYLEESKVIASMQRLDTDNDNLKDEAVSRLFDADDEAQYRSQSQ